MDVALPLTPRFLAMRHGREDYGPQLEILVSYLYHHVVEPGSCVADGGANAGLHAWPLARLVSPDGYLACFEPIPDTYHGLCRNLAPFIDAGVAHPHRKALGALPGTARFTVVANNHAVSRIAVEGDQPGVGRETIDVEVVTLDDVMAGRDVAFIKLDLEGFDFRGIQGARGIMARSAPPIIFENGRGGAAWRYGYSEAEFHEFFESLGYVVHDLHNLELTPATWSAEDVGFEFIAMRRDDPRRAMMHQAIDHFWRTAPERPVIAQWTDCMRLCGDPVPYVGRRFDGRAMA